MNETRNFTIWDKITKRKYEVGTIKKGREWVGYCPLHSDHKTPNLHINAEKKMWFCFVCWRGGALYNPDFKKTDKNLITIYGYQDKDQNLICKKFRFEKFDSKGEKKKDFPFQTKNEKGNWIWGLKGIKPPLYNLPNIIKANPVFIAEGEMDVLNLKKSFGAEGTTTPFGAGPGKWLDEYNEYFKNKKVVILYDNDKVGKDFAQEEGNSLVKVAEGVKVIDLPGLKTHGDISDWIKQGHTKEEFFKLIKDTPLFESTEDKLDFSKMKFNPEPYSEIILKKYSLKYDNKHRLFIWNKSTGLWDEDAVSILNSILRKKLLGKRDYKRYCVEEIIAHLKGLCRVSKLPPEPPPYLLPFKNLIYNLDTETTEEYSPDYFFINKFRINYVKGVGYEGTNQVKGDVVMEILKQIIPEEHLIDLLELAAYCMYRKYPYPKMFILYGDGRNGKSAYYDLLIRIFGLENISTVTSLDLQRHRFSSGRLYGKLLNVTSEMEYEDLKKTSLIKKLTGGDPLDCERKFKETFLFHNYAKQIFITNSVPETSDKTPAFYSRPFLTEFPRRFEEGINAEPDIFKKLAEDEIEGFAYKLIPILNDLRAREPSEFVFTNHKDIEKTKEEYEKLSTPLAHYIKDNTIEDVTGLVYQSDLLQRYMQFVADKGGRGYSGKMLSEKMRNLGYISNTRNPRQRVAYEGIRWKEETKEDLFEIPE